MNASEQRQREENGMEFGFHIVQKSVSLTWEVLQYRFWHAILQAKDGFSFIALKKTGRLGNITLCC
jgi:hypothetical protein